MSHFAIALFVVVGKLLGWRWGNGWWFWLAQLSDVSNDRGRDHRARN
jgi:hypothetical protein